MTSLQYFHFSIEIWSAFFSGVAFIFILMTRYFDKKGARKLNRLMICSILLMLSDALAWWFRGNTTEAGYYIVRITNFCAFFFGFLMMPLIADYISHIISKRAGIEGLYWKYIEWAFFSVGTILLVINLFHEFMYTFDEHNTYHRLTLGVLPGFLAFVGIAVTIGAAFGYIRYMNNFERVAVILFLLLPLIGTIIQTFHYGLSLTYISLVISILILFFSYVYDYMQFNIEKERILTEERMRLVNQQIQPHFIFNSLSLIRHLCKRSSDEAVEAINEFSGYLRNCTDFLNEVSCIPATREFDLIKHYVYMEQKRFGKSISVEYEIEDTDFEIPPFAIQTSVENAIKHGLRAAKIDNGKIKITSRKEGTDHIVEVEDNGVGFDVNLTENASGTHVGIKNTQERLELMCNGNITIQSKPNEGTKVTITVPEKKG